MGEEARESYTEMLIAKERLGKVREAGHNGGHKLWEVMSVCVCRRTMQGEHKIIVVILSRRITVQQMIQQPPCGASSGT